MNPRSVTGINVIATLSPAFPRRLLPALGALLALLLNLGPVSAAPVRTVGVARVDITPAFPIRLNGYFGREVEATNAAQHLFAKALAFGGDPGGPAVLIVLDNGILPHSLRERVVEKLRRQEHLDPARIVLCATHTHCAPCLTGAAPNLFGHEIPAADQAHIDRYTRELIDQLVQVATAALRDRRPARLGWGRDAATFAANRRTQGGPVDTAVPFLTITDTNGALRAIFTAYACHCTTLGRDQTNFHGDWAGCAQEFLEKEHPGALVLTAIGCGADANPEPRGTLALVRQHGRSLADSVNRGLERPRLPLAGGLECRLKEISLPFDPPPTREEWQALAQQAGAPGYHARKNLARMERGEPLERRLPYWVQEWNFGDDLALVFLAGEVVVDYALRLRTEFATDRLWLNAYANDIPAYIPSRRILREGGYEGGGAMVYYDHPTPFTPAVEDLIIGAVRDLVPAAFRSR